MCPPYIGVTTPYSGVQEACREIKRGNSSGRFHMYAAIPFKSTKKRKKKKLRSKAKVLTTRVLGPLKTIETTNQ